LAAAIRTAKLGLPVIAVGMFLGGPRAEAIWRAVTLTWWALLVPSLMAPVEA
jgi:hypothetical protein